MRLNVFIGLLFLFFSTFCYAEDIHVHDFLKRDVTLKKPAKRIVALAPHIVENVYSAGAGAFLVGAVDHSDYPAGAETIPRVGNISGFSIEAILALKPDLVILWYSGRGTQYLPLLEKLNIPVYASNPLHLEDIPKAIRDYGHLAATSPVAEKSAKKFEDKLQRLTQKHQNIAPQSVFYEVWDDPLQTLNGKHIISHVIELCGGKNIFDDALPLAPKVSVESIIYKNPDVIVASGMGEERPDWLDNWKKYAQLTAVKKNNLYFVPPDIIQRHTLRLLDGAALLCEQLDRAREI